MKQILTAMTTLDTLKNQVNQLPVEDRYFLRSYINETLVVDASYDTLKKRALRQIKIALNNGYQF
ncbi:MAG: hypothetical protein ACJA2C_001398 [Marinoscillum sp.]|jgi:hypothetical protein